jgi:hypothetical protein
LQRLQHQRPAGLSQVRGMRRNPAPQEAARHRGRAACGTPVPGDGRNRVRRVCGTRRGGPECWKEHGHQGAGDVGADQSSPASCTAPDPPRSAEQQSLRPGKLASHSTITLSGSRPRGAVRLGADASPGLEDRTVDRRSFRRSALSSRRSRRSSLPA